MDKRFETDELPLIEKIFEEYSKTVFNIAYHIVLSKQEAEEVVQEVFIKYGHNYKQISNPKYWLIRVAHNLSIDKYRSNKRLVDYVQVKINAIKDTLLTMTSQINNQDCLEKLLTNFSEKERSVLTLKLGYDYNYHEIAEILEMPEGTAKSIVSRFFKKI